MDLKDIDIPASIWSTLIISVIIPILKTIWMQVKNSVSPEFRINSTWSKKNKDFLEVIEKAPAESFACKIALNSISQSLISSSADAIYKASRPQNSVVDWLYVITFGILASLTGTFLPKPFNIIISVIFLLLLSIFEFSALLRSELNKQFKKFIRFSLVDNQNSQALMETPEIAYKIFEREARRSAYRTSRLISNNYSNWPTFWKIIKKCRISVNKIFILSIPESRYGIILKYINKRKDEIYGKF